MLQKILRLEKFHACHVVSCSIAAHVTAPRPLAGEGIQLVPQWMMGEGASSQEVLTKRPLTQSKLLNHLHALSRKGRGRSNDVLAWGTASSFYPMPLDRRFFPN